MRELQLADAADGIEDVFADIVALAAECRFADCSHESEPGCAVQAALEDGTLDAARYARYRKLAREDARNSAALHERRARERDFGRMVQGHHEGEDRAGGLLGEVCRAGGPSAEPDPGLALEVDAGRAAARRPCRRRW